MSKVPPSHIPNSDRECAFWFTHDPCLCPGRTIFPTSVQNPFPPIDLKPCLSESHFSEFVGIIFFIPFGPLYFCRIAFCVSNFARHEIPSRFVRILKLLWSESWNSFGWFGRKSELGHLSLTASFPPVCIMNDDQKVIKFFLFLEAQLRDSKSNFKNSPQKNRVVPVLNPNHWPPWKDSMDFRILGF